MPARKRASPKQPAPQLAGSQLANAGKSNVQPGKAQKARTGLVDPVLERWLDAVTSQHGATGGEQRLVWLRPDSVSRTALASRQPILCVARTTRSELQPGFQSVIDSSLEIFPPKCLTWKCLRSLVALDWRAAKILERKNNCTVDALSQGTGYSSRRPSMAFSIVISSVYSISLPTGIPMAMRVTFRPCRFNCCDK